MLPRLPKSAALALAVAASASATNHDTADAAVPFAISVVVERASRPDLVPQNDSFTPLVMHWMSWELAMLAMNRPSVALAEQFLSRYPLHRDAPLVQWEQAETYALISNYFRAGAPEAIEPKRLAAEARARLTQYVGSTPWTEQNRNDAEAIQRAIILARSR